jgi:hypothetical protein
LSGFFEAANLPLTKHEYYQIASQMSPEDIPSEVKEKLDSIYETLGLKKDDIQNEQFN